MDLQALWTESEAKRQAMIARVRAVPENLRQTRPKPGEMAPTEVLDHLARVEAMYPRLVLPAGVRKPAKPSFIYRLVFNRMSGAKRAPTGGPFLPKEAIPFDQAVAAWDAARAATIQALAAAEPSMACVRHPLFGRLAVTHVVAIFDAHVHYHLERFQEPAG